MRKSLTRQERLRRSKDIRGLFTSGRRVEVRGVKLLYQSNGSGSTRMAVVVARGCGGAVKRNREKRLVREAYRTLKDTVSPGNDLVFLVVRFGAPLSERHAAMAQAIGRAGLRLRAE